MKKKAFIKDIIRTIYNTKSRFLSILAIITIGVAFYAGINASEPDMFLSADRYFKENNLSDFRIISPLGFSDDDFKNLEGLNSVKAIEKGYFKDLFIISQDNNQYTSRVFSYKDNELNTPILREGRFPEKSGEILLEYGINLPSEIQVGSKLKFSLPKNEKVSDFFHVQSFEVVGLADSPMYLNVERGQTNIGDGSIGFFAYIDEGDFNMEDFTEVYVKTRDSDFLISYSDEYEVYNDGVKLDIQDLGIDSIASKTQDLRDKLQEGRDTLQENKEELERQLGEAREEMDLGEKKILDGERELERNEEVFRKELDLHKRELDLGRRELDRGKDLYYFNYSLWIEAYNEYQDGRLALMEGKGQLDLAKFQLDQGEIELANAKSQLDSAKSQLDLLENALEALKEIRDRLPDNMTEEEFKALVEEVRKFSPELARLIEENFSNNDSLRDLLDIGIKELEASLEDGKIQYENGLAEYEKGLLDLEKGKREYEKALAEYNMGLSQLDEGKKELDKAKLEFEKAKKDLDDGEVQLLEGEEALFQGESEFEEAIEAGRLELEEGKIELEKARAEFEMEEAKALEKIQEAEEEIREAERQILEIPEEWFVLTREDNPGYSEFGDDASRIGALAKVFPLFFFLVAALVCLTTMSRMIEEERTQIGTLKALGYSPLSITMKYLIYSFLASIIGSIIGFSIGFKLFPSLVLNLYRLMYNIPYSLTPFHWDLAILSTAIAVFTTVLTSLFATINALRSSPAVLMQPKAPKPGKRILLERFTPLWSKLSFTNKLTARNIFRYKKRFFMTVIGIGGCTALLIAGFGIRDSVTDIMRKQFDEIFIYDGMVMMDTEKDESLRDLDLILGENYEVDSYMSTLNESVSAFSTSTGQKYDANLLVPEDGGNFRAYYDLHERVSGNELDLSLDGAIITEKLADLLDLDVGDRLKFRDSENRTYEFTLAGVTENYIGHSIFMSKEYFSEITLRDPIYNSGVFLLKDGDLNTKILNEKIMDNEGALATIYTGNIADEFNDTLDSLNYVVLILIISAGALAFVVLYNLTNINIMERIREIATIKVLGFRDKEVSSYVYKENIVLSIVGTFIGLFLGLIFHRYVINTMELDILMFGRNIKPISFVLSIVLTMVFSLIVNFFMYYKLKNINMVESLKSVD